MNMYHYTVCLIALLFSTFQLNAQKTVNADNWFEFKAESLKTASLKRNQVPEQFKTYQFDFEKVFAQLKKAPQEFSNRSSNEKMFIELPMPDGHIQTFEIFKTRLMAPELKAKFPEIQTFGGKGATDPRLSLKLELTSTGMHAQILNATSGTILIDPIFEKKKNSFICFNKKSVKNKPEFNCHVEEEIQKQIRSSNNRSSIVGDCQMRVFRLALATTFEYSEFHGGTISSVMSAMVTTMNRVNALFERDASIRMEFIANNDELIFLTEDDPYTNNNGGAMLGQNQTTIDNIIGSSNYDIGHVFSTGGGGVAFLQSPCGGSKAGGVTGLGSPVGDVFDVDFVAHEMGHQYGGTHTFNNACGGNRSNGTAVEPGSGSTIMAYAGICNPNVQNNSDDYFHGISIEQMVNFSNQVSCPEVINFSNNNPSIDPLESKIIPRSTPFELTAVATDQDGDLLTYCWDQIDIELGEMPPQTGNTEGPLFRSLHPTLTPSRVFPALENVINNTTTTWEVLPGVGRDMEFRCTVRDNNNSNGCNDEAEIVITVAANAGPFLVVEPNTSVTWLVGESKTIIWDEANTSSAPVNAQMVDILLSTDGGFTYPVVLAQDVPNTGTTIIDVPNQVSNSCRVRIQGSNNVFFDISDADFNIEEPPMPTFTFDASPTRRSVCTSENSTSFNLTLNSILNFDETVSFSVDGLPSGAQASFSQNTVTPDASVTLTIENINLLTAGDYDFNIVATSTSVTQEENVALEVFEAVSTATSLLTPFNGSTEVGLSAELSWDANLHANDYLVEVSTSLAFESANIVYTTTIDDTNTQTNGLMPGTVYYWRILASNQCGIAPVSETFSFQTALLSCQTFENNTPVSISTAAGTISSTINVPITDNILDVNVSMEIEHTWVGDLTGKFQNPSGSEITLFDRPGVPEEFFGCGEDDLNVSFDDEALLTRQDFEDSCETGDYAVSGNYQTFIGNLFFFDNRSPEGDWKLVIEDQVDEDGGSLLNWAVEICTESPARDPILAVNNLILEVPFSSEEIVAEAYLKFEKNNISPEEIQYTITSLPISGDLKLETTILGLGDTFTQDDINTNKVSYTHNGDNAMTDKFTFDVLDSESAWVPNNTFNLEINQNTLMMSVEAINTSCNGANDGQITLTTTGGMMPYSYSIDGVNFQNENTFSNLAPGDYILTVKDANDFTFESNTISITAPDALTASLDVNENNITINASGGTGTLSYSLDGINFQNENNFPDLENGSYIITVKDENDCTTTLETSIAINNLSATANIIQNINCFGDSNGSISVNVTGGTPPLEYSLDGENFQTSNFFENLSFGTYTITIIDALDFTTEIMQTLDTPTEITGTLSVTDNDIIIDASGGTGTLSYSIDGTNFISSNEFLDLANGMYTVYAKDENGCILELNAAIMFNSFTSAMANIISEISCYEGSNGSINVIANGGTPPLEYSLDGENFQPSNFFDMLIPGTYSITVRDADDFTINTNTVLLSAPDEITGSATVDVNSINVIADGGTGNLQYSIDGFNFQNENSFPNLSNGTYTVYVRDENGCQIELEATVAVNMLAIGATLNQDISCNNENDATVTVNVAGGSEPYEYSLDGENFQSSPVFENLGAGSYTFTARDNDGFFIETNNVIVITNPEPIDGSLLTDENNVSIQANGGTGLLTYSQDGSFFQTSNFFGALNNGDYTFYIQDENGCTITLETTISFNSLSASFESTNLTCFESEDGTINVVVNGGMPDYTYSLNEGDFQNSSTFSGLPFGEYMVTVKDADDFTFELNSIVLTQPDAIVISTTVDVSDISVQANGGTGTLTFSLDNDTYQTSNEFSGLPNGSYTIYVKDENDCIVSTMAIVAVNGLVASAVVNQSISCFDFMDASITANIAGGVEPYEYSLDGENFQSTATFENLGAGDYVITIRDADGFESMVEITISNPEQLELMTSSTVDMITLNASGGTGTYQYSLNNDDYQEENIFAGLTIGTYTVYVRDENGCIASNEVEVSFNNMMVVARITEEIACFGEMDGVITVEIAGGTGPFEYSLDGENFQIENRFENLSAGMYMIIVRDANGFTATTQLVNLVEPDALTMMLTVEENTITVDAIGGTGIFTYSIDGINYQDSNIFAQVPNGTYVVVTRDENGCEVTDQALIAFNSLVGIVETTEEINCFGELATIVVTATGGQAPYTYSLDGENYQSENTFANVEPGIYTIYIQDAEDFLLLINNYTIVEPELLTLSLTADNNVISAEGMGGTGILLYSLDGENFEIGNDFGPLVNGSYIVYVQDENGCVSESEIELNGKEVLSITTDVVDVFCSGDSTGTIAIAVQGGFAPYTFTVNSPDGTLKNLPAGEYTVVLTDALGTMITSMVTIFEPAPLILTTNVVDNNLTIEVEGGTGVYQFTIDGGQFYSMDNTFSNLELGDYTVGVLDENGCTAFTEITISSTSVQLIDPAWGLKVFPNPAHEFLQINIEVINAEDYSLQLTTLLGQTVKEVGSLQQSNRLELSDIPAGNYFLRISNKTKSGTVKLVKH